LVIGRCTSRPSNPCVLRRCPWSRRLQCFGRGADTCGAVRSHRWPTEGRGTLVGGGWADPPALATLMPLHRAPATDPAEPPAHHPTNTTPQHRSTFPRDCWHLVQEGESICTVSLGLRQCSRRPSRCTGECGGVAGGCDLTGLGEHVVFGGGGCYGVTGVDSCLRHCNTQPASCSLCAATGPQPHVRVAGLPPTGGGSGGQLPNELGRRACARWARRRQTSCTCMPRS
jgi:hypothetical protein